MTCTRCQNTGFLNFEHIPENLQNADIEKILEWIKENPDTDAQVCDCCGDGEIWYGVAGEHYMTSDDKPGHDGPYAYNGGLCECS